MDTNPRSTVVGIFDATPSAKRAVAALQTAGFTDEQIGCMPRIGETTPGTSPIAGEASAHLGAGLGAGAVIGGLVGAAAALVIPGVGPALVGGMMARVAGAMFMGSAVVGAVGGALVGGLLGVLTTMVVPKDASCDSDEQVQAGGTIVTVKDAGRAGAAAEILYRLGAHDVRAERLGTPTSVTPTLVSATNRGSTVASATDLERRGE